MSIEYNVAQLKLFIAKYNGKSVSDPWGLYKNQCVSLCKMWLVFNGWPMRRGNAINWTRNGYDGYAFYPYHTGFIPNPGDMGIFHIGKYGHIGIVVSGDAKGFKLFNQNYPHGNTTDPAQVQTFNYSQCSGFLRKL